MADDAGKTRSHLELASDQIEQMDFFQMLALLEQDGLRFGRSGGPDREPARLGQSARLSFATQDLADVDMGRDLKFPPKVAVNVIGLLGPEGPMPLHLTRWIMERLSNRWFAGDSPSALADTSFLDLVNMLQHRMMAFYWRAWADARPEIHIAHDDGGKVSAMLRAFAGLGLPGTLMDDARIDGSKLRHATSLVQDNRSPDRLTAFVSTVIEAPVSLSEFVGVWIDIPGSLQTQIGKTYCRLGKEAVVGARSFDRQSRAELRIGPLSLDEFTAFSKDRTRWDQMRHAVIFASGKELEFNVRLILAANDIPDARLGHCQLGRTIWLNPDSTSDADDLCYNRITRDWSPMDCERARA